MKYRYPQRPASVNKRLIQPTKEFRREVIGVVKSIVAFIFTYIFLVIAGAAFACLCAFVGYWIVTVVKNFWGIVFGIGCVGLGVMVLFFLLKFVFKSSSVDRSNMLEVTAKEQPLLFQFIRQLAAETETRMPKKVYVSADANASVFYDSGFWSMFFPVRKNLNLGLALVNSLNVSEFKAVIAHEFGHFSQKSMKLGSYVYHVNHIIHDMLYDNDGYDETLEQWSNVSGVFSFFAALTQAVVTGIQKILQALYATINERYLALSRQMEFHADAIAASLSGSAPLIDALYRLDVAHNCYETVLRYYDQWIKENKKGLNLYAHQKLIMQGHAESYGFKLENDTVQALPGHNVQWRKNRILIKDQWTTHPATHEREAHLKELNIGAEIVTDSAWAIFTDPETLQRELTAHIYTDVNFKQEPQIVDAETFRAILADTTEQFSFNKIYKGFYDGREIAAFDPEAVLKRGTSNANKLSDILTNEVLDLRSRIEGLNLDVAILNQITDKSSPVKTFDFEGIRYNRMDAMSMLDKFRQELTEATTELKKADEEIFLLYCKNTLLSTGSTREACRNYSDMFASVEKGNEELKFTNAMLSDGGQLFHRPNLTQENWFAITQNMHREADQVKARMQTLLKDENLSILYSKEEKDTMQAFIDDKRKYFFNVGCDADAINLHMNAVYTYSRIIAAKVFQDKKKTLEMQALVIAGEAEYA